MSRRSRRRRQDLERLERPYEFPAGEDRRTSTRLDRVPRGSVRRRIPAYEVPDDIGFLADPVPAAAVYPWQPLVPLRVYYPSPYRFTAGNRIPVRLAVNIPKRVRFCVQRKERRQVLFALNRAGYSGSARARTWIRRESSNWRC